MKPILATALLLCITLKAYAFSCAPDADANLPLNQRFYKTWKAGKPLSEITILEEFAEVNYFNSSREPSPNDEISRLTIARVDKVYTGCPVATPYYVLFRQSALQYFDSGTGFQTGKNYVIPLPDRKAQTENEIINRDLCLRQEQQLESLTVDEVNFLDARLSCCDTGCACFGADRQFTQCPSYECTGTAPCASATRCRVNPCDSCAEEWFTDDWQIPCVERQQTF